MPRYISTPENIVSLRPDEVFVFGSNRQGAHGAGAAKLARDRFGAVYGQARGLQGQSYAVVTKDLNAKSHPSVPPQEITNELINLYLFAAGHPELLFLVTKLGCGLGGFTEQEMRQVFVEAQVLFCLRPKMNLRDWTPGETGIPQNIILPKEFMVPMTV